MKTKLVGKRAEPERGAQPEMKEAHYGEAEPRLTSGGEAVMTEARYGEAEPRLTSGGKAGMREAGYGEAEPRLTSSGKAVMKRFLRENKTYEPAH